MRHKVLVSVLASLTACISFSTTQAEDKLLDKGVVIYNCSSAPITVCMDNTCKTDALSVAPKTATIFHVDLAKKHTLHLKNAAGKTVNHEFGAFLNPIANHTIFWTGTVISNDKHDCPKASSK